MNRTILIFVCLCLLFTSSLGIGTSIENKKTATDVIDDQQIRRQTCSEDKDCAIDHPQSNETSSRGVPDSHELLNKREGSKTAQRKKRSTGVDKKAFRNMLLGIVHKKSDDMVEEQQKFQSDASELLLELMVRIAAHPQQWDEVHDLLQKIDSDILTSKKILTDIQNGVTSTTEATTTSRTETATEDEVQKLIILLDNENQYQKNTSRDWPNLDDDITSNTKDKQTTQNIFPWKKNSTKEFEFAYHRVTGLPLPYRSNYDKTRTRNAYIAVSVIAPKNQDVEKQDNLLEDELRQLKPWSHEENLNKMENIRKNWFVRQDEEKEQQP